jgi:hypothetical protein
MMAWMAGTSLAVAVLDVTVLALALALALAVAGQFRYWSVDCFASFAGQERQ